VPKQGLEQGFGRECRCTLHLKSELDSVVDPDVDVAAGTLHDRRKRA